MEYTQRWGARSYPRAISGNGRTLPSVTTGGRDFFAESALIRKGERARESFSSTRKASIRPWVAASGEGTAAEVAVVTRGTVERGA
eukprot:6813176-Prymnesium_polylepis.1